MQQPQITIDLQGKYPDRIHYPMLLAHLQGSPQGIFLLLDTGYSKECGFETSAQADQFRGEGVPAANKVKVELGPFTALNPLPEKISYNGAFLDHINILPDSMARAMPLTVSKAHVTGITAAYLLGPFVEASEPHYPERQTAFWIPRNGIQCPVTGIFPPDDKGEKHMKQIFGRVIEFYTTPISIVPPGDPIFQPNQARRYVCLSVYFRTSLSVESL